MQRTLRQRVNTLRGLIDRRVNPNVVMEELNGIFRMIENESNHAEILYALTKLMSLSSYLSEEMKSKMVKMHRPSGNIKSSVVDVNINEYADCVCIEIDKLLPPPVVEKIVQEYDENYLCCVDVIKYKSDGIMIEYRCQKKTLVVEFKTDRSKDDVKECVNHLLHFININRL